MSMSETLIDLHPIPRTVKRRRARTAHGRTRLMRPFGRWMSGLVRLEVPQGLDDPQLVLVLDHFRRLAHPVALNVLVSGAFRPSAVMYFYSGVDTIAIVVVI